jgi:hypothetical protein
MNCDFEKIDCSALNLMQSKGLLIYNENQGEVIINSLEIIDKFNKLSDIPLPIALYLAISPFTDEQIYPIAVSALLSIYDFEYEQTRKTDISREPIIFGSEKIIESMKIIGCGYDLYNPRIDKNGSVVWFSRKWDVKQ